MYKIDNEYPNTQQLPNQLERPSPMTWTPNLVIVYPMTLHHHLDEGSEPTSYVILPKLDTISYGAIVATRDPRFKEGGGLSCGSSAAVIWYNLNSRITGRSPLKRARKLVISPELQYPHWPHLCCWNQPLAPHQNQLGVKIHPLMIFQVDSTTSAAPKCNIGSVERNKDQKLLPACRATLPPRQSYSE